MGVFGAFAKHGVVGLAGFVLGLLAIAIVQPVTANGKVLLLITVVAITIVVCEVTMLLIRLVRASGRDDN